MPSRRPARKESSHGKRKAPAQSMAWTDGVLTQVMAKRDDGSQLQILKYFDSPKKGPNSQLVEDWPPLQDKKPPTPASLCRTSGGTAPVPVEKSASVLERKRLQTGELSSVLTKLLQEWFTTTDGHRTSQSKPFLPLRCFAEVEWDHHSVAQWLNEAGDDGIQAATFREADTPNWSTGLTLSNRCSFARCVVLSYEPQTEVFEVQESETARIVRRARVEICFVHECRFRFFSRLAASLTRRCDAEALMRLQFIIAKMPQQERVSASLGDAQVQRVTLTTMNSIARRHGRQEVEGTVDSEVLSALVDETLSDYRISMNSIMFNLYINSAENAELRRELCLRPPPLRPPVPAFGTISLPISRRNFRDVVDAFRTASLLASREPVAALQAVSACCVDVSSTFVLPRSHTAALSLGRFVEMQQRELNKKLRLVRDDWPQRTGSLVRQAMETANRQTFDIHENIMAHFKSSGCRMYQLLHCANYSMADCLRGVTEQSLRAFADYIRQLCACEVTVHNSDNVSTRFLARELEPLFTLKVQSSTNRKVLNEEAVQKAAEKIKAWRQSDEALVSGAVCPVEPVTRSEGFLFEYDTAPEEFQGAVLGLFDACLEGLGRAQHIQKFVMERLFWPVPDLIQCVSSGETWAQTLRREIEAAMRRSIQPLHEYLTTFLQWQDFLNRDVGDYINSIGQVKEPREGDEDEVSHVNVVALRQVLEKHSTERQRIMDTVPADGVRVGIFFVRTGDCRTLLVDKHQDIINRLLSDQLECALQLCATIDARFSDIQQKLRVRPENIEQVSEVREFISTMPNTTSGLVDLIAQMMDYFQVLEDFHFRISSESNEAKWTSFSWPVKVAQQCHETGNLLDQCTTSYLSDMTNDQEQFQLELDLLEQEVVDLVRFSEIPHVSEAAEQTRAVASKIEAAEAKVALFNSRESLFDKEITDYGQVSRIKKAFEPFFNLWSTAEAWLGSEEKWIHGPFNDVDAEVVEESVEHFSLAISKALKFFERSHGREDQASVAHDLKAQIDQFKPYVPLLLALRNKGMRPRHWEQLSSVAGFRIEPSQDLTLRKLLDLNMLDFIDQSSKIAEAAAKEYTIEQTLDKMVSEWSDVELQLVPYRDTRTSVLKGVDDINAVLDEHVTMTQAMQFSAFKGPFEQRIDDWNHRLNTVSEVLESWLAVQRNWMYLQPIFESPDINKQLPTEGKKFATVDKNWRQTISSTKHNKQVLGFCSNEKLLERFKASAALLDQVQRGLNDYLETKRGVFARFYFLSNDDLLSILSESKDPLRVQPHMKKCFEAIESVKFEPNLSISRITSPENENVTLSSPVDPNGKNVEAWMLELEAMMVSSVHDVMHEAIVDYAATPRTEWIQKWPAMCVLNGSQMHWTSETEDFFRTDGVRGPRKMLERQVAQLEDMIILVRGDLPKSARTTVGALTVIDVHARDVMQKLVNQKVTSKNDFGWSSQLRYYWEEDDLWAEMVAARRPYGYEYLGNTFRLVITPLTDKCYLTLMGALQMTLGGAPAGPAGTGKTETTKDLAKALAMQCVVFNCSDGLDYKAMGKFFKGLASCGAWACFDEFNRINVEVLSVIGQQIVEIQLALRAGRERIVFEESDIAVKPGFGVFITMNPGYAGRSALPDSLEALFRPVAMMVPDYALIGEIMFIAYGFSTAKECGSKMVTTFRLCSEQCSSQPHYDYGMRAVKTVITAAGNLKRAEPDSDEMVLLLRALQDVNVPKFLDHDLPLFEGIISDLFPGRKRPDLDYGALQTVIKLTIQAHGLQPHPWFIQKVVQLYDMIVVRHGLMLVGPTGGAKTSNLHVLRDALGTLRTWNVEGFAYERVVIYQLNPKSITMGQMYGQFDDNTREWQDGIMSTMYRTASSSTSPDRKWIMFNGPVDAIWIENMNTVLDDNKKLCLVSGESIKMSPEMTMMFEVMDLLVASPATVSRVGIVYMEPKALGIDVLMHSWLDRLPRSIRKPVRAKLWELFEHYVHGALSFLRTNLKEQVPTVDNNLVSSLMRILDCYFEPFQDKEGRDVPGEECTERLVGNLESLFIFALVWSVGATTTDAGRERFSELIRGNMAAHGAKQPFPPQGQVYDYVFDQTTQTWKRWMDTVEEYALDPRAAFADLVVPTTDSVRNTFMLDHLVLQDKHVLMVGPTGTGKSLNISQYLSGSAKVNGRAVSPAVIAYTITFSAQTTQNMTQDMVDSKLDKRRRGVYGPPVGKKFVVHVDDVNMPKREFYGAQPPIEILRQWFDQGGWYERHGDLAFRTIVDLVFVGSMGPPGGGRQEITPRFLRHFNIIGLTELSNESKATVFGTILRGFLANFSEDVQACCDNLVEGTIRVFDAVTSQLLPTPLKSHYTFNLRDLAKVFQGLLMGNAKLVSSRGQMLRLWAHECQRVFEDRLVTSADHFWFQGLLRDEFKRTFRTDWDSVMGHHCPIFVDFLDPNADPRVYEEAMDLDKLKETVEDYLADHNSTSKSPMPLVMFLDAVKHVASISRVLRQPGGNALLLGVGGSGRQSMTRLAAFISGFPVFQVEIVKGYGVAEWREDLRRILLSAALKDKPTTFLFSDVQIVSDVMLEDINNILNSGDVPNLYGPEEMDQIMTACRADCSRKRIPPTKLNIFAQYVSRVKRNLHISLCMSPLGETFRERLRMFPSLVNCCTIDWFTAWPGEALSSVGTAAMTEVDLQLGDSLPAVVEMFKAIHQTVEEASKAFFATLRRHNYVTPTSFLELLSSFKSLLDLKREENNTKRKRLQVGLDKLTSTKVQVGVMQDELTELQPQLVKKGREVDEMMVKIASDKEEASKIKASVEVEENKAQEKAQATQAIADDAQKDLDEAIPALDQAVKCLDALKKSDIDEIKAMNFPPAGVKLTMEVCCHYFQIKPVKDKDPNDPTKKIDNYFAAAKTNLLSDAKSFMSSLVDFDKDNIPERVIQKVEPYMSDEAFMPHKIKQASVACEAICMWARAMHKYHYVALGVAPKRAKLAEAKAELDVVMAQLADAQAKLQGVVDRLEILEANFNAAVEEKASLEAKAELCKVQLSNAEKLIGGLGGEEARWKETVAFLERAFDSLVGDVLVSAGTISYLGPFTASFRVDIVRKFNEELERLQIPHTSEVDMQSTLTDPVKLRSWQLAGLPSDSLSSQNAIMMDKARRWPLLIDPQGQANRYIKTMGRNKEFALNGIDLCKLSDKTFLRTLENGVRFGRWVLLENVHEELDAALEPILLQQKFKQGGQEMIKVGDNNIPYSDTFRFFITSKLPNPHYTPEVQVKVTLINFTVTPQGLEEQLLGIVVEQEQPDLAQKKSELVIENAAANKQLFDIESQILFLLSNAEGNILDDTVLIDTLAEAKMTSEAIKAKMKEAEVTTREIFEKSEEYRPVAYRASILYFCISELHNVDPMYQYALPWFTQLFVRGVQASPPAGEIRDRCANISEYFTFSLYANVCRSLFEAHKLLFSFLLTAKIMQGDDRIDSTEWRFLISGISSSSADVENPDLEGWVTKGIWAGICCMAGVPVLRHFPEDFAANMQAWRAIFDSVEPHTAEFPKPYDRLTPLQRMCVLRCLRRDKITDAMHQFVVMHRGKEFVEPPPFDLRGCYHDSSALSPLIFVLSKGSDPAKDLLGLAEDLGMSDRLKSIALGQGQGTIAERMIAHGMENGDWVLLQNCHLCVSWMPELERITEEMEEDKVNPDFRLWLTSMPSTAFPVGVLQHGVKMTKEPPRGVRANLKNTFLKLSDEALNASTKPEVFPQLLFGLCFYHALTIERKKYGALGWNVPYSFNETDLDICVAQLRLYVDQSEDVPYTVLRMLTSLVNYGGRITDDKDMRTADILVGVCINDEVPNEGYKFSRSGVYHTIKPDPGAPWRSYMNYIDSLPLHPEPEVFGMHDNASITCAINDADDNFAIIMSLQPRSAGGSGVSREERIDAIACDLQARLPAAWDIEQVRLAYPTDYHECLNTTLTQEVQRYNNLLAAMHPSLVTLQRALKGLVVLSSELEAMGNALFDQRVPENWQARAYPSLKMLNAWFSDLLERLAFLDGWIGHGAPATFWISGFFFPQGFMTANLQNHARKYKLPIDEVSNGHRMMEDDVKDISRKPDDGCFIHGLFVEGARWDRNRHALVDPQPKELFSKMPVVHLVPEQHRQQPKDGIYRCPVYKVLTRTGTLSTTGHSTNFVFWLDVPSSKPTIMRSSLVSETNAQVLFCDQDYWVKAGVACFCALRD